MVGPEPPSLSACSLLKGKYFAFVLSSKIKVYFKHNEFVKYYDPVGNKVKKAIFSEKVTVKVGRSSSLFSFERASLVEYACQI